MNENKPRLCHAQSYYYGSKTGYRPKPPMLKASTPTTLLPDRVRARNVEASPKLRVGLHELRVWVDGGATEIGFARKSKAIRP
ncbi:unnamed protein product [Clavelina lepadiformis]|uniref:Ribosomal protein L16 n=1 Tax=Clavelina lepadiformis TaxID=159417 RepID=A0ABP0FE60_CLALP